jgi:hypothetical protein
MSVNQTRLELVMGRGINYNEMKGWSGVKGFFGKRWRMVCRKSFVGIGFCVAWAALMMVGGCKAVGGTGGKEYTAAAIEEEAGRDGVAEEWKRPARGKLKREREEESEPGLEFIVFQDRAIEVETRRILEQPEGGITVESVLGIKRLELDHRYVKTLADLRWFSNLEQIIISGGNLQSLKGIEELDMLTYLNVSDNRITSLEPLRNLKKLDVLMLSDNKVYDISPLAGLEQLEYLELNGNQIEDIEPIRNLPGLRIVDLYKNPIPKEELDDFYGFKEEDYFVTTVRGRLREDMPEFDFEIEEVLDKKEGVYRVRSIIVSENGKTLQTISIPELTSEGQTRIFPKVEKQLILEDMNFDGYQDIRLYDTLGGGYRVEWVYLLWNPNKEQFEHEPALNDVPAMCMPSFDQENKKIYGMVRYSAGSHGAYTYEYIDGVLTKIVYELEEWLYIDDEDLNQWLSGMEVKGPYGEIWHSYIKERNQDTKKMEVVKDEYTILSPTNSDARGETLLVVSGDSEIGRLIAEHGR